MFPQLVRSLSTKKSAPHGAPRPDILSPWRRRLSLPIPCHVHWPRSCCQRRARTASIYKKACFRGHTGCTPGRVYSGSSCVRGARVRRGCAAGAWAPAWVRGGGVWRRGRAACVSRVPLYSDADACSRCAGERVGSWATRCLPAGRGRACVGTWAGEASGGSFGAFAPVAVCGRVLCGKVPNKVELWPRRRLAQKGRVLYGKVPNKAYSQGSQEFSASAGAYRPCSLTDAQEPAVACQPHTPLCVLASYLPCILRFHSI
jgi:hypothetical protein